MKKLIFVLCSIFIASVAFAGDTWAPIESQGYYKEVKCEICGKLLREWVKTSSISGNYILTYEGSDSITFRYPQEIQSPKPLEKAKSLGWSKSITVCQHCRDKFREKLRDSLSDTYNKWLETAISKSKDRAITMQEQAKEYRLQALRKELADFKREMQEKIKQMEVK